MTVNPERITISQAAQRFNLSASWLRRLCEQGRIASVRYGKVWTVDPVDVAAWIANAPQPGRPKKIVEDLNRRVSDRDDRFPKE